MKSSCREAKILTVFFVFVKVENVFERFALFIDDNVLFIWSFVFSSV